MNTISKKYIVDYIEKDLKQVFRHDVNKFVKAIRLTAKIFNLNRKDLFHFIIGEGGIPMATSYGFHTAYGRDIVDTFTNFYHNN